MTYSVAQDQTALSDAVWSESALFAYAILSETLLYEMFGYFPQTLNRKTTNNKFTIIQQRA